jgi:LPLT family lysophospholipid transporter-like MFS transporter
LLESPATRSVLTDLSIFWASAATLRILLIAWASAVLGLDTAAEVAELTLYLAFGIVLGSGMAPRIIPLEKTQRTGYVGATFGLLFLSLAQMDSVWPARFVLAGIGIAGGLYVVPLNAKMQRIGHQTIGSGAAVAIQNSIQNLAMLAAVGCYTLALSLGVGPTAVLSVIGMALLLATVVKIPQSTRN